MYLAEYPFKDHNPPDIELIDKFCKDVYSFLNADRSHVVAIHCKAGKGRTGTMICCYLLYNNTFQTANEALTYYAEKRTRDKKGVTIPSQRRYVEYYEQLLRKHLTYRKVSLYVLELRIFPADLPLKVGSIQQKDMKEPLPLVKFRRMDDYVSVELDCCMPLAGDVKVEFRANKLDKGWHFWFNTFFVELAGNDDQSQGRLVLTLDKKEIDDAHKGSGKKCPEQVQVFLNPRGKCVDTLDGRPLAQPLVDGTPKTPNNHHVLQIHPIQKQQAAPLGLQSVNTGDDAVFRPGLTSGNSSLAVMLYDASALQFGYASAGNDAAARVLQESRTFLTGATAKAKILEHGKIMSGYDMIAGSLDTTTAPIGGSSSVKVSGSSKENLVDSKCGTSGGGSGKNKLSSSSPFRRFGMAMRRRKKRSLKLKHATGGNGAIGGNTLYGSCASNLSGISVGNVSTKGMGLGGATVASDAGGSGGSRTKLKFRWLRNMRSDPNLKETLAKSVQLRPTSHATGTGCIVGDVTKGTIASITSVVTIPKSPTSTKMPIPDVPNSTGGASDVVVSMKEIAGGNLPTDYYSFLCDNQLSYESPSKSPGHMMRLELALARRPSTIEEVLQQPAPPTPPPPPPLPSSTLPAAITVSDTDCSVVKPRASNVKIGFNVSTMPSSPIDTTGHGSIESSFEIINKSDAPIDPSDHLLPASDSGTLVASGVGHGFCNKLLHHIVTSVGGGSKAANTPIEPKKQDADGRFEYATGVSNATHSSSRSSSSCSSLMAGHTLPSLAPPPPAVQEIGGSPVLSRSNRCAPFSFREFSAELRAAMKIPIPKHRSHQTAVSSSSSSSSSNIAAGATSDSSYAVRSIERTLSAPVAVQTLDSSVANCEVASFPTTAATTTSTSTNASSTLNRSLSDRQLGDDHRSNLR
uniref:Phosphatidylinositol-3,4,5-trisphosphate 3-phosphatase n=1 Tax=Anopheles christyi TaxID=43041 RepID=A0A182KDD2_9DIPT